MSASRKTWDFMIGDARTRDGFMRATTMADAASDNQTA